MENQRHPHKKKLTPEEKRRRKEKLFYQRSSKIYFKMAGIFLFFLIIAFAFNLFSKDKKYSESENRMLAQKPEFSMANLASGKYMKDMEDYVTDQFFIRDKWINLKVLEDLTLGKRESNGVYIGKKDHLMEIPTAPNQKSLDNNLDAISNFAASHPDINTVMTLIPNAAYVYDHLIPRNAPVRDQEADIKYVQSAVGTSLNFVDLTKTMTSHKDEEIYYKTDHHWTTLGAKYAFDALSTALGIDSPTQEYTIYPVTHSFQGTLTSKSGYDKGKDTIELYIPQNVNTDCLVNFVDEGKRTASMYESAALENKDKYEVFFGGNHSRIDISTPMEGKKNLLLFKDSYANCFIPFLAPYYRNIIVIDPRYYYDNIESLITDNEITDILFLYNVNTFLGDTSLGDVLAAE